MNECFSYEEGIGILKIRKAIITAIAWTEGGIDPVAAINGSILLHDADPAIVGCAWFDNYNGFD